MTRTQLCSVLQGIRRNALLSADERQALEEACEELRDRMPRVLALEEAEMEQAVWLEFNGIVHIVQLWEEEGDRVSAIRFGTGPSDLFRREDYGRRWRCWNAMPDEATRKGERWHVD